jgi:hypothetical protein
MSWMLIKRAIALVVFLFAISAGGCSSSNRVSLSPTGHIGPLRVDKSDRRDVIAFAGKPDSERHGRYSDYPTFDALGYGCAGNAATDTGGGPRCKTVFYLDSRSGKLALVYTEDDRFVLHGVQVGTPKRTAERFLHMRAFSGCFDGFRFETKTGFVVVWLGGGHVLFVVVHSQRLNPGVLDCIDS